MKDYPSSPKSRPNLKPYQLIAGVLIVLWLSFIWIVQLKAQESDMVLRDMKPVMAWGVAAIVGSLLLIFSTHWWGNALASEKAELANYRNQIEVRNAERQATQARTYALEIRGVGLGVYTDGQSKIWQFIKKKNDNFASIYPQDAKDYNPSLTSRESHLPLVGTTRRACTVPVGAGLPAMGCKAAPDGFLRNSTAPPAPPTSPATPAPSAAPPP